MNEKNILSEQSKTEQDTIVSKMMCKRDSYCEGGDGLFGR